MPHAENDRVVENTNEARAAVTGHNVRSLLVSTLAVIVLFAVAYIVTSG